MSLILKLCAVGLGAALLAALLREQKSPFVLPLELTTAALLVSVLLASLRPRFASFFALLETLELPDTLLQTLLKGAGVCLVSEFCAETCRAAGNAAIADVLSFGGRLLTLLLCLPLCEAVLQTAAAFL